MTGRLRRESQIKESLARAAAPLLPEEHETSYYGSSSNNNSNNDNNSDVNLLIQRRRASSMHSSVYKNLHLASTSLKDGEYQPVDTNLLTEMKMLLKTATPLVITLLLQYSLNIACVFFVGNIGKTELAAVSLANLLANVSSFALIEGIASSLSTLCPQAYGRKDYKLVSLHAMRCFVMLMVLYVFIYSFWTWGSYPLLSAIIIEKEAAYLAAQYLKVLAYSVPGFIVFEVLKLYLQAQGIFHASTVVLFICAPINILLTYCLVWNETFSMGFIGAPISIVITNTLMASLLLLYTCFIDGYQCWCGLTWDIFKSWSTALKLAGPGVVMIEAEWLAFEIISFASSRFGTSSLAAQSIVTTICITIYQVPFAFSIAGSTRIAWFIGSASKEAAFVSVRASVILSLIFGTVNLLALASFPETITSLFSEDEEVIKLSAKVLMIGAIYQIPDFIACVLGGVLRGQARQYIGGYLNLCAYYILALPTSLFFGFYMGWELFGLWTGLIVGLCFLTITELYYVLTSNWDLIIESSLENALESSHNTNDIRVNNTVLIDDESHSLRSTQSRTSIKSFLSPVIVTFSSSSEPTAFHI